MKTLETNLQTEKIMKEAEKIINQANTESKASPKSTKTEKAKKVEPHTIKKDETSLKVSKNKKSKKATIIVVFSLIIILALIILSFIFAFITSKSDKIISGVSINGVDVSNLSKDEALQKLATTLSSNTSNEITLTHNDYSTTLNLSNIEASFDYETALNDAYNIGRTENNIFANNAQIISTSFEKTNITPTVSYNEDALNTEIERINNELPDKVVNSSYKIEDNNLIISNSANGNRIENNAFSNNIKNCILTNLTTIELPVEQFEAATVDINAIYNEIHKDPVNAYYSTDPYEVHKEEDGLDFNITLEEAQKLVEQDQESFTIPLKVVKAKVTVKDLPSEAFPNLLATYSTTYSTGNANRATNIALAAKSVNGYVLMPDETFSYNSTVGQRTAARGYKEAGVYVNGEVTTGLGGGICQVSSTLYNAVLLTNLEIVERTNHTFKPGYVPAGQDATVSWGSPDFKFKNNRNYPIKIVASASNGTITFNIYGLKSDDDYEVKIQSYEVGTIAYSTQYQETASLPAGTQKVTQAGSNGCKTQTYKILYKNGAEVSRTLINSDTYKPHNQIIAVGTGATTSTTPSTSTSTQEQPSESTSEPSSESSVEISY